MQPCRPLQKQTEIASSEAVQNPLLSILLIVNKVKNGGSQCKLPAEDLPSSPAVSIRLLRKGMNYGWLGTIEYIWINFWLDLFNTDVALINQPNMTVDTLKTPCILMDPAAFALRLLACEQRVRSIMIHLRILSVNFFEQSLTSSTSFHDFFKVETPRFG